MTWNPRQWTGCRDARELLCRVNLLSQGLASVRDLAHAGEWEQALDMYRRHFFARLSATHLAPLDPRGGDPMAEAALLLDNRVSLLGTEPVDIGDL